MNKIRIFSDCELVQVKSNCIEFIDMEFFTRTGPNSLIILRDALNKRFPPEEYSQVCDLCDEKGVAIEFDELGNDCWVCGFHADMLAAKKPERKADEHYSQNKGEG